MWAVHGSAAQSQKALSSEQFSRVIGKIDEWSVRRSHQVRSDSVCSLPVTPGLPLKGLQLIVQQEGGQAPGEQKLEEKC